ncbi:MAG: 3-dehydroquinate synthase [Alistipes sp.]|nr:3-dehydroquinate synthase [Alistipes sp.]
MNYFCSTIITEKVEKALQAEISAGCGVYMGNAAELLAGLLPKRRVVVITDANIDRLYHPLLCRYDHFIIGTGETIKTLYTVSNLYRRFIEAGVDRSCFVLGIGGGIVTDIAGFVASTYMRGLEFGFVSTSLLGQVDASIGGKNGVNVEGFKNMVGTFTQPKFVICDTEMLATLPDREFRAGMAEIIKVAIIADGELFRTLENSSPEELRSDTVLLSHIVKQAAKIKLGIVERDEKEKGERRKLNLGHTVGHAIEKCLPDKNHGEAVATGIAVITRAAENAGLIKEEDANRILHLLERYNFELTTNVTVRRLANAITKDKKSDGDHIRIVFPTGIGQCEIKYMPQTSIAECLIL